MRLFVTSLSIKIFTALVRTKKLDLKNLKHFVLDECDKMLAELDMRRDVQVCIHFIIWWRLTAS